VGIFEGRDSGGRDRDLEKEGRSHAPGQSAGDHPADDLFARVYEEIHRIAHNFMVNEGDGHLLQTTALVNDAYVRLIGQTKNSTSFTPNDERHLLNTIALAMRHVLIDDARKRTAGKRGVGLHRVTLDSGIAITDSQPDHQDLHEALILLEKLDFMTVEVVNLRFYCGKTMPQIADLLGVSTSSVERNWEFARAWLRKQLTVDDERGA